MNFSTRLKKIMTERNIGLTELVRLCHQFPDTEKLRPANIGSILDKGSNSSQYITQIAAALNVDAYWLATGQKLEKDEPTITLVDLVSQADVPAFLEDRDQSLVIEKTVCRSPVDSGTIAVQLTDDSMQSNIDPTTSFFRGSQVVIQCNEKDIQHEQFALVILEGTRQPILRQMIEVGRDKMWRPFNTMYRHEEVSDQDQIIGRVSEKLGSLL